MRCPNCAAEFDEGRFCPSCGADTALFSKTVKISDSYYNNGLAMAKNSDMSGAIDCLQKSLTFNKHNISARNLLGLVFYETGRVGDALQNWRVSVSQREEGNPAGGYIQQLLQNSRHLVKLNDAINMYNAALEYVRQKSDDMAIIQLKKAVEINPCFVDALNLLSLSYMMQGENEKASGVIDKTLAADINNPLALRYYQLIHADKARPQPPRAVKSIAAPLPRAAKAVAAPAVKSPPAETGFNRSFPIVGVISFIIGALSAFAILYILIMPERIAVKDKQIEDLRNSSSAQIQTLKGQLDDAGAANTQLADSVKSWSDKYAALEAQTALNEKTSRISEAERLMANGLYQEAVDTAAAVDKTDLPSDLQDRLQNIVTVSYPKLVEKYFNDGEKLYTAAQYDEARDQFNNAMKFVKTGDELGDDVLYYLGRIATRKNDNEAAKQYFQQVLDEYPDGSQAANAASRLKSLG